MENKKITWIVFVLDESGSMSSIKSDTIGSFNEFLNEQKKVDVDKATFTLVKFNSDITKLYDNIDIKEVGSLNEDNYLPSRMTKLYDAIGFTIKDIKNKIKELNGESKPDKVLFVILTDGLENKSVKYKKSDIMKKITKRENKGWKFIYLGANQDAMEEGGKIGIKVNSTNTWKSDAEGVKRAFWGVNNYTVKYRSIIDEHELNNLDINDEMSNVDITNK